MVRNRRTDTYRALPWVLCVLGGFALIDLGLFIWGINRGFDVKDEAFMVLCYRFPQLYAALTTSFHIMVNRFTGGEDIGILGYRWLGFSFKMLSMLVFAWGFWKWLCSQTTSDDSQQ